MNYTMRYSIRDVAWLTIVVAVACGWYANRREWEMRNRQLLLHDIDAWGRVINAEEELEDYEWRFSLARKEMSGEG